MLTWNTTYKPNLAGKVYKEGACLSGDAKPTTNIMNGSKLLEMDTGTLYVFDEANSIWRAWQ